MFSNLKPTFGTPASNTSFAFSSNVTPNPFGQSTFGKPATPGFGAQPTAFGSGNTTLFGSTSQHGSPFATGTPTATFGQPAATQPTFGSGMFGSTAAQPSSSGLFGSANTSAFGQQNKPTGFGFGSTASNTGFFGQPANQVQTQQPTPGLFGQSTPNLFGNPSGFGAGVANVQMGTVIKFTPVTGTDTMVKGSINQTISTRHHCITCMKEYENKSLEELRWEDYQANRKGPQQGAQPATGLFASMAQPTGGLFGSGAVATASNTLFGQTDNKAVFGTASQPAGFGQPSTGFGATSVANTTNLFGKSLSAFGTNPNNTSTFAFNSNTQPTNLFGANTATKPFGATPQPNNIFGQSTTGFGTPSTFGSFGTATNQNVGLFNQSKTSFNMGQTPGSGFGGFGQPAAQNTSLFPGTKTTTGFGGFGNTTATPLFGQSTFGQPNQSLFGSSFNKPATPLFGQTNSTNTLGTMGTATSLFGNAANKTPNMFGSNLGMFNSGFGNTNINTSFGMNGINVQPGVTNTDPNQTNPEQHILSMSCTPYGITKLLNNVSEVNNDLKDMTRPTNPNELNALLNTVHKSPCESPVDKLQPVHVLGRKIPMFDGLERKDDTLITNFRINTNPKRLVLRNRGGEVENNSTSSKLNLSWSDSELITPSVSRITEYETTPQSSDTQLSGVSLTLLDEESRDGEEPTLLNGCGILGGYSSSSNSETTLGLVQNHVDNDREEETYSEAKDSQEWQQDKPVTIEDDDNKSLSMKSTAEPHPTGIILTRAEYYTVPSMDELVKYVSEDGSCIVKGFTVGRVGYGNVYFPDTFDVSNLDLDELVHFRHKEINIYPNDSKKPPLGQALNRKAQVTLDKVWPYDKKLKMLITDIDTLNKMDYASRLRRLCEKQNTRFMEYRPETGSWVFKVDHFSKYGQPDSDDSDEEIDIAKKPDAKDVNAGEPKPVSTTSSAIEIASAECARNLSINSKDSLGFSDIMCQTPLNLAIDSQDVTDISNLPDNMMDTMPESQFHLMKRTFFENGTDFNEKILVEMGDSRYDVMEIVQPAPGSSPQRPDMFVDVEDELEESIILDFLDVSDELDFSYEAIDEPQSIQLSVVNGVIPMPECGLQTDNIADVTIFKGRSFKVGWGKNLTFACLSTRNVAEKNRQSLETILQERSIMDYSSSVLQLVTFKDLSTNQLHLFENSIEEYLYNQLSNSQYEIINGVPHFSSVRSYKLLRDQQRLSSLKPMTNYLHQIFDLCVALWGRLDKEDLQYYDMRYLRRVQFSTWLRNVVSEEVDKNIHESSDEPSFAMIMEDIFTFVSGNRLEEAALTAFNADNVYLSLLLPQLSMNMSTRVYTEKQLEMWNQSNSCNHISKNMLKLYMLLAGKPAMKCGDEWIHVYEDLDWIRSLAMFFWYIIDPVSPLSKSVQIYEETFLKDICAKPVPLYLEESDQIFDLRFQLLKFYSDNTHPLVKVLNSVSFTDDPLDYRLSWLLLQALSSLGYNDISEQARTHFHTNFAAQLERMGLWHWAIFVLLFIEDTITRSLLVKSAIERHVQLLENSTDEYRKREIMLVKNFKIPREWIDSAKATLALLYKQHDEAVSHLYFAKEWGKAQDILNEQLVPEHLLCYDYEFLIRLLNPLSAHKNILPNWDNAGGLMLDFSNLCVLFHETMVLTDYRFLLKNLINFRTSVTNIGSRLEQFNRTNYMHDVCIAEMCGRIVDMLRKIIKLMEGKTFELCREAAVNVQSLPMSGDYLKRELGAILKDYLSHRQTVRKYYTSND